MAPYERLQAWQLSHALVIEIYRLTSHWPDHERFGLISQVRRAAVSIPTNIPEGSAKRGPREFRRFLDVVLGSIAELTYLLRLAHDLGYITTNEYERIEAQRNLAGGMAWRLYKSIRASTEEER